MLFLGAQAQLPLAEVELPILAVDPAHQPTHLFLLQIVTNLETLAQWTFTLYMLTLFELLSI